MSAYDLARPEIRDLVPYSSPVVSSDFLRLNANESMQDPYESGAGTSCNRYPELRPDTLASTLGKLFSVDASNVCPARGSTEGIDLLIRTFCRAYTDNVVILPPTFEMYAAYAVMQGLDIRSAPLATGDGFSVDWGAVASQCDDNTRVVFLCSPNNPTGNLIPESEIRQFLDKQAGKSIVVVDEAYIEFSSVDSLATAVEHYENLVVLRTLSKAYALAGARCGALVSSQEIVGLVSAMASPYAISHPVTEIVLNALQTSNRMSAERNIAAVRDERQRLIGLLEKLPAIDKAWPSSANFILVRFANPNLAQNALEGDRILIRQFGNAEYLEDCARITVGSASDTDRLIAALTSAGGQPDE